MMTTLASTFTADHHSDAGDTSRLTNAAGRSAIDPIKQIRPRSSQYTRRWSAGIAKAEALNCTTQVKHGTIIPTDRTSIQLV